MRSLLVATLALGLQEATSLSQTPVLTRSYDDNRTGANISETVLTPRKVLAQGLEKIFSLNLTGDDPRIEAQPLYAPEVMMGDGQKHAVIYVFSMSNHIWAFDANTGTPFWGVPVSLGSPFLPNPKDPIDSKHINKSFGILSTPVIDLDSQTMYVVDWLSDEATHQDRNFQVHALRLADGKAQTGKETPLSISATITNSAGDSIALNQVQKQRAALLLWPLRGKAHSPSHKMLYVATTGTEQPSPGGPAKALHGWVVAFDVDNWKQAAAWVATPSSFGGGIWQGSQGPAADEEGNVYFMTGNGGYVEDAAGHRTDQNIGITDFPESFVKLRCENGPSGYSLTIADWFIPFRDSARKNFTVDDVKPFPTGYEYTDQDLASAGPILPPDSGLLLGSGKDGVLYVFDKNNLGKAIGDFSKLKARPRFFTFEPDTNIASFASADAAGNLDFKPMSGVKTHHLHGSPVYWKSSKHGGMLFVWGENETLRAFALDSAGGSKLLAHGQDFASATLADPENNSLGGMPGGMLTLSANGSREGIVWATAPTDGDANAEPVPGVVRAYDAANFEKIANPDGTPRLRRLWQTSGFTYAKFCPPVVADGKVIVPTYDGRVDVYGLRQITNKVLNPH